MRTPIAYGLSWPERVTAGVESLDLMRAGSLDFEAPNEALFPCLRLARQAAEAGRSYPAALNAANEVAVDAFLHGRLGFMGIASLVERVLGSHTACQINTLEQVMSVDAWARSEAERELGTVRITACGASA